jgi:demethylmenaquinone methyltransferase/2-methoxy-6-polyprenyl-1,4-benzoquinol methylase
MNEHKTTDFGFEDVPWQEKAQRVRGVFDSVAGRYDVMNDLMSGGAHRLWKHFALSLTGLQRGQRALDVAGGTGDLSVGLAHQVGQSGLVVLTDINAAMLAEGRDRLINAGLVNGVQCVQANAECLPFAEGSFDCVTIGFGLRNVTDKPAALASMRRVLKPGGQLLCWDSEPTQHGPASGV